MSLGHKDVHAMAALAKLEVTAQDVDQVTQNLAGILEFVEQLQDVNTDGVAPMAHPLGDLTQRLRPDSSSTTHTREQLQANAGSVGDGFYRVPKVIE